MFFVVRSTIAAATITDTTTAIMVYLSEKPKNRLIICVDVFAVTRYLTPSPRPPFLSTSLLLTRFPAIVRVCQPHLRLLVGTW